MFVPTNLRLALLSAAVLGFRHGLDYDHIAAITDISSVQSKARDAMRFGLLYVAGHATTIAILGSAAVVFRIALPPSSDRWAERLVGITLLVLGVYVLGTFFRESTHSGTHSHSRPRTRITLLINGALWIYWRLGRVFGGTRVEAPQVFKDGYGTSSTFLVGVIHGLGAETPTQILLFLMAANLGGTAAGLLGLLDVHRGSVGDEYANVCVGGWIVLRDLGPAQRATGFNLIDLGLQHCGGRDFPAGVGSQAAFPDGMNLGRNASADAKCAVVCTRVLSQNRSKADKPFICSRIVFVSFWNHNCR